MWPEDRTCVLHKARGCWQGQLGYNDGEGAREVARLYGLGADDVEALRDFYAFIRANT